jgi:hypothetical protein
MMILPTCLCALVPAALFFGLWWGTWRVHRALPPVFRRARDGIRRTRDALDGATRTVTRPIFYGETQSARLRAMWRALRARLRRYSA